MINKRISLPGRNVAKNELPPPSARSMENVRFASGIVEKVDVDRQIMLVDVKGGLTQGSIWVDITQPFAGTSSFIQATPEEFSNVLLAITENGTFIPVTYSPNYTMGFENRIIKEQSDSVKVQRRNQFFFRFRKLEPGHIALGSKDGIEIFLGDHLKIDDRGGNSILLRPEDNAIINTSNNNYVFNSGVWVNSGIIRRNSANPLDLDDNPNLVVDDLSNKQSYVLRPIKNSSPSNPYYTEYLIEVEDRDFNTKQINDVNSFTNKTVRKPIAIFSLGNFVGNNPDDAGRYGKILRPVLFTDPDDEYGDFSLEPVYGRDIDTLASAISLFKPNMLNPEIGAYLGIDKEGHFFQYLPSATGGGLGKGRSMSILARGSKKEIWGMDSRYGNSWDMRTTGGIKWVVGSHNERDGNPQSNRSIDIRSSSSSIFLFGEDLDDTLSDFNDKNSTINNVRDYLKIEKIDGKERKETNGVRETIIRSNDVKRVEGKVTENIIGAKTVNVGSNINTSCEVYSEKVSKEKNEVFGYRKTTVNQGSIEIVVDSKKGNISEEIKIFGNRSLILNKGDISETIRVKGNRIFKTTSGNYTASTNRGNMSLASKSGNISYTTKRGKATMSSTQGFDITTSNSSNVNIKGGSIKLKGKSGGISGVITTSTHNDYITGAPLRGSTSVKATR